MSIVKENVKIVRKQIEAKINRQPFLASQRAVTLTVTDRDAFPYPRFYRGVYESSKPVVVEREAGWRQLHNDCYEPKRVYPIDVPLYCWQPPCSTVFPCRPAIEKQDIPMEQGCVNISI